MSETVNDVLRVVLRRLAGIYNARIPELEAAVKNTTDVAELEPILLEASSFLKALDFIASEGFPYKDELEASTHASAKLELIVSRMCEQLQCTIPERFELMTVKRPEFAEEDRFGEPILLEDYVAHLERVSDQAEAPIVPAHCEPWLRDIERAQECVLDYVAFLLRSGRRKFVCLLRDCLPISLSLRRLQREGWDLTVRDVAIGRSYIGLMTSGERTDNIPYRLLTEEFYRALNTVAGPLHNGVVDFFRKQLATHPDCNFVPLMSHLSDIGDALLEGGDFTAVETGCQGTIPLLLLASTPKVVDFTVYTTFPWLANRLEDRLLSQNFHHLHTLEAFISQAMFKIDRIEGTEVFVSESLDTSLQACGYAELWGLMRRVEQRIASGAFNTRNK